MPQFNHTNFIFTVTVVKTQIDPCIEVLISPFFQAHTIDTIS